MLIFYTLLMQVPKEELELLSRKQQDKQLECIKQACQEYIQGQFRENLREKIKNTFERINFSVDDFIISDKNDVQQQTLLIRYPSVITHLDDYIQSSIKIEAGAKSALDPHTLMSIQPYITNELPEINLSVSNIAVIEAERTFWDKVIILHGIRCWYDSRKKLRQNGHRISRHYYDLHKLMQSSIGEKAIKNFELGINCARHAQLFFNSSALNLKNARPGSFSLIPTIEMQKILHRDYIAMADMIFGDKPEFNAIINTIHAIEKSINQPP